MSNDIDVAEVLEKAADDIAANGLSKHTLLNSQGQCCAIGALARALGLPLDNEGSLAGDDYENEDLNSAAEVLADGIGLVDPSPYGWHSVKPWDRVVFWNNHKDRTADEVVEAMRHAAKDLRNEATP
jgi:hypothetical protein